MNIFILADDPRRAFERVIDVLRTSDLASELKAAYREIGHDSFTILYPAGLTIFTVA
jgi:hypothetical protein